jgi:hypothetical protein
MVKRRLGMLALACAIALGGWTSAARSARPEKPVLQAALTHLQKAKRKLSDAMPDAGGHRQKAIELTEQAIGEVKKAISSGS